MIPEKLSSRLAESDLFVFTWGGCHIFARELLKLCADDGYIVKQVVQVRGPWGVSYCLHVFLQSGIYGVDALGIRRLDDFVASYYSREPHNDEWTYHIEDLDLDSCFEIDPAKTDDDPCRGPVNKWELFLHPVYVKEVEERARKAIEKCRERYSVKALQQGITRMRASDVRK